MPEALNAALLFVTNSIFDIYLFVLIVRIILVWVRADYFNPLVQFVARCTDFLIKPLRHYIPNIGKLETSTLFVLFSLEIVKFFIVLMLTFGMPNFIGLVILAVEDIIKLIVQAFFYGIMLQVILSWVQPFSPLNRILLQFTGPIMRPIQRVVPPIAGIDISPIPALMLLQVLIIMVVNPLMAIGSGMAIN